MLVYESRASSYVGLCNCGVSGKHFKTYEGLESLIKNKIDFILFYMRKSKHISLYFSYLRQYDF